MTPRGPAEVLTAPQVRSLIATFPSTPTGTRNRALVVFLWRTGLRIGETLQLDLGDLSLTHTKPTARVRDGKNHSQHTVGLHPEAVLALRHWLCLHPSPSDLQTPLWCTLLPPCPGKRLKPSYVRHMLRRQARHAQLPRVHPHAFRATLAVELVSEGVPLPTVRDVLGHSGVAVTDAYLRRVFPELAIDAVIQRA